MIFGQVTISGQALLELLYIKLLSFYNFIIYTMVNIKGSGEWLIYLVSCLLDKSSNIKINFAGKLCVIAQTEISYIYE